MLFKWLAVPFKYLLLQTLSFIAVGVSRRLYSRLYPPKAEPIALRAQALRGVTQQQEYRKMDKAFDLSDLVARLKAKGIEIGEDAARELTKSVFSWTKDSCLMSNNAVLAAASLGIPKLEEFVESYIDKIDGKSNAPASLQGLLGENNELTVNVKMAAPMADNGAGGVEVHAPASEAHKVAHIPEDMIEPKDKDLQGEGTPGAGA